MAYTRRKKYGRRRKSLRGGKNTPPGKKGRAISEKDRRELRQLYSDADSSLPTEDFNLSPDIEVIAQKRPDGFIPQKITKGEEYVYTNPKINALIKALEEITKEPTNIQEPTKVEKSTKVQEPKMVQNAEPVEVSVKKMSRKKHHPPRPPGRIPWGYRPGQYIPNRV
jgi:hypothetical protein